MLLVLQILCVLLVVAIGFALNYALRARREYRAAVREHQKESTP